MKGRKLLNYPGQIVGNFKIIERVPCLTKHNALWLTKCLLCGSLKTRTGTDVRRLTACPSCAQKLVKPNFSGSNLKEYDCWRQLLRRCFDKRNRGYKYYGARGISVSLEWQKDFWVFYSDMGPMPKGYSIERIDNSGNYCKENCQWIPRKLQARNRRSNKKITINGITKILAEWLELNCMSRESYYGRLKMGWSIERALTTPIKHR